MDVRIDELHSTVDTVGTDALLSPEVVAHIVAAVRATLAREAAAGRDRAADLDTRSVVDQQRAGRR
jgi:hypothetical protein